jgi:pimeloyl-ACP methyl ester carboxylesterase
MLEPRFVTANGLKFGYLEQGTGPLVLLVHGFPDTAHTWDKAIPELAKAGYRAVAPFTRGYFPTEIPKGPFDSETQANDLLALIEALGEKTAIIVGHDWGASAAYAAAALGPERVRLLVTLAIPHPSSIKPRPQMIWALRHFLALRRDGAAAKIRKNDYKYVDELWERWSPAWKSIPAAELTHVKAAFAQPGCLEAACAYYKTISPRLPKAHRMPITVPTVSFAGEHDDMIKPRHYEKARHWFTSSYEVVQMPGGHFMHREHPAEFNAELVRVIRDHDKRAKASA